LAKLQYPELTDRGLVRRALLEGGIPAVRRLTTPPCSETTAKYWRGKHGLTGLAQEAYNRRRLPPARAKHWVAALERTRNVACAAKAVGTTLTNMEAFRRRHRGLISPEASAEIASRVGRPRGRS